MVWPPNDDATVRRAQGYFAGGVTEGAAHDATLLLLAHAGDAALAALPVLVDQVLSRWRSRTRTRPSSLGCSIVRTLPAARPRKRADRVGSRAKPRPTPGRAARRPLHKRRAGSGFGLCLFFFPPHRFPST